MVDGVERPDVDERSFDLAMHFLAPHQASEDDAWSLAGEIQQAVEDWFADREDLMGAAADRQDSECGAKHGALECARDAGHDGEHIYVAVDSAVENQCPGTIDGNHVPTPGSHLCALCRQPIARNTPTLGAAPESQCPGTIEGNHVPTPGSDLCALCRQRIGAGTVTGVTERG